MGGKGRTSKPSVKRGQKGNGNSKQKQVRLDQLLNPRRSSRLRSTESSRTPLQKETNEIVLDSVEEKVITTVAKEEAKSVAPANRLSSRKPESKSAPVNKSQVKVKPKSKLSLQERQELLKDFDLNFAYGPCRGILRRARFLRALKYKLKPEPPAIILDLLDEDDDDGQGDDNFQRCIWDQNLLLKGQK